MRSMQGRVVCATNDKTVSVEVVRLAPHPKYKRRVRKKKKFQAHDPDNQFKVGDYVQLEKSKPISKTKAFIAVPAPLRNIRPVKEETGELGIPLESQQPQEQSS
ncbi:Ribosomal protein S17 [Corchorus olitorius]|uniref:30S ribosomal protein S17, chloroplastic n=1 Tax=Corchorus olitorius TaxID=93759 RepID=A0A1R3H8I2_9ROSI|nr:Ribosomal protein S17 [Corchorus olitorius]